MKVCVWRTGHEIADTIGDIVYDSMLTSGIDRTYQSTASLNNGHSAWIDKADIHIGYGILRGMDEVFRACNKACKPWFNIDKGYWKPGHYDGYYRVSLRGTQQTAGLDKLKPDYERWDKFGVDIPASCNCIAPHNLLCPPSQHVCNWLGISGSGWIADNVNKECWYPEIIRNKGDAEPIDWNLVGIVTTFNSSVGWEALRQGVPVISDPTHSIIGAYVKQNEDNGDISFASRIYKDVNMRRELFALMAGLQLTLAEIKSGLLWPLIQKLLTCTSGGTVEKPLPQMSQPIQSEAEHDPI